MRKMRKIEFNKRVLLSNEQMKDITGASVSGISFCKEGKECKFYVASLKMYITGNCVEYITSSAMLCYCKNGAYRSGENEDTGCLVSFT
jgi:hypothetical protein